MKGGGTQPKEGRLPLWSVGCAVPDLLEDVEQWQQEARGCIRVGPGRWQWHLVGPGQGGLGTTPVRESNPIARRDQNVRDGRPCVMRKKKETAGRVLPRRTDALAALGNESDRVLRVRLSKRAEAVLELGDLVRK